QPIEGWEGEHHPSRTRIATLGTPENEAEEARPQHRLQDELHPLHCWLTLAQAVHCCAPQSDGDKYSRAVSAIRVLPLCHCVGRGFRVAISASTRHPA